MSESTFSQPIISVITVVKDAIETLPQTMDSVINQLTDEIEYIVIDGGSSDGSAEHIQRYSSHLSYWHSRPDNGICDAFNVGINKAQGQFIGILSADDYYEPDTLKQVLEFLKRNTIDEGVLHGSIRYLDSDLDEEFVRHPDMTRIRRVMSLFHASMFVSKLSYHRVGMYDVKFRLAMDSEWVHRAIASDVPFYELDHVLANVRLRGVSHKNLYSSLKEFHVSTNLHFGKSWINTFYLWRQLAFQSFLSTSMLKPWLRLRGAR